MKKYPLSLMQSFLIIVFISWAVPLVLSFVFMTAAKQKQEQHTDTSKNALEIAAQLSLERLSAAYLRGDKNLDLENIFKPFYTITNTCYITLSIDDIDFTLSGENNYKKLIDNTSNIIVTDKKEISLYGKNIGFSYEAGLLIDEEYQLNEFFLLSFLLTTVSVYPFLIILIILFYKGVSKNIYTLETAVRNITSGNYSIDFNGVTPYKDFLTLQKDFLIMSNVLKKRFEKVYTEELGIRDARMRALQSQINPHFLNNTLEIIKWEILLKNSDSAIKMMEALSTMMKAATDRHNMTFITLKEELEYLDAYLFIIKQRSQKLNIIKNFPEETLIIKIPRLILQPIVENAVEHGESKDFESSTIRFNSSLSEEFFFPEDPSKKPSAKMVFRIDVENSSPLSEKDLKRAEDILSGKSKYKNHIGILNVKERLKLSYGDQANFEIMKSEFGTLARITIAFGDDINNLTKCLCEVPRFQAK